MPIYLTTTNINSASVLSEILNLISCSVTNNYRLDFNLNSKYIVFKGTKCTLCKRFWPIRIFSVDRES